MRSNRSFTLEVDLQINEVTCPGVWLCPYGRLSLEVYMLDTCVQTDRVKPIFPLIFNEQYQFRKTFDGSFHTNHLRGTFDDEYVYMELIQWECDGFYGGVLASFKCPLDELLVFPAVESYKRCECFDLELLMQPSKSFPGILSPKIEVTTTTTVKEGPRSLININDANARAEYGDSKSRTPSPSKRVFCQLRQQDCTSTQRQRRVCHSTSYHKSRKCFPKVTSRPVFAQRKPDSALIMRQVQGLGLKKCRFCNEYNSVAMELRDRLMPTAEELRDEECRICVKDYHAKATAKKMDFPSTIPASCSSRKCYSTSADTYRKCYPKYRSCTCGNEHDTDICSTCAKYMYYFDCNCCYC